MPTIDQGSLPRPWNSLVEGGEGLYLPNCLTNLVIALYTQSLLFCMFLNTTANKPSSHVSPPRLSVSPYVRHLCITY